MRKCNNTTMQNAKCIETKIQKFNDTPRQQCNKTKMQLCKNATQQCLEYSKNLLCIGNDYTLQQYFIKRTNKHIFRPFSRYNIYMWS